MAFQEAEYYEPKEGNIYFVKGKIAKASSSQSVWEGYGVATIRLLANHMCAIDFEYKVETADATVISGNVDGISPALLKALNSNIPTITPLTGGIVHFVNSSGYIESNYEGYGGMLTVYAGLWAVARMYQASGSTGTWAPQNFPVNYRFFGTAYGTWADE